MACFGIGHAKKTWDYAKGIIEKELAAGRMIDFPTLTHRISDDIYRATGGDTLGANGKPIGTRIVPEDIARLISMPKSVKVKRNALLMSDRVRQATLQDARAFVEGTEQSPMSKLVKGAYEAPYAAKVVAHGPALHMTHAWPYALDPKNWVNFGKTWINAWKSMNPSRAQAIRESIQFDPKYDEQVKSGLAVDPRRLYDDVNRRADFWGKLGQLTSGSFLGLKQFRQVLWNSMYDSAPEHLKTQELRDLVSKNVNHMTGASPEFRMGGTGGKIARGVLFAPSLDVARVMRIADLGRDTGITMRDAVNRVPVLGEQLRKAWGSASPEAKWIARQNMKQWARIAAVYSGLLYANGLLLKHFFGSKEEVNVKDPFKADWLAIKGPNGRVAQITGGQIPMIRTGIKMIRKPEQAGATFGQYLVGKINPALSIAKTVATGKTFGGEAPAPLGTGSAGVGDWTAFLTEELGPIATEEGIKEFAKQMSDQNGVPEEHNAQFLRAFGKAALVTVPAALGTHTYQPEPRKTKTKMPF